MEAAGGLLYLLDRLCLAIFVAELAAKLAVYRTRFHRDPWNVFDFIVVGIALLPATGSLSVLQGAAHLAGAAAGLRRPLDAPGGDARCSMPSPAWAPSSPS